MEELMKKFLAVVLVLASVLFAACGSSISDETRSAASDHIGKISLSLSNASFSLRDAKDALAANSAYSNFAKSIADLTATEATLAKNEGYALVAQDKVLREKITKLSTTIVRFTNDILGNNKDLKLEAAALDAGKRMLGVFTNARFAPIEWIRACDDASTMISDLTKLMEATHKGLLEAKSGKDAGAVLVAYAASVKALSERGQMLEKRYPFFKKVPTDPILEKPVAELRAAMVKLGNELKNKEKAYKDDKDFNDALKQMKDNLTTLKK